MRGIKILYVILGTISLITGIIGIIVPGLPTTIFLLFAATMYFHGNKKFHDKLLANKYLGKYISDFQSGKGMSLKAKIYSIITMWIMISISAYFATYNLAMAIIIFGLIGTLCILFLVPLYRKNRIKKQI
ncbi:MAG: YbaN family protein [Saprospiraceae bacterium]|nr:YbaN family protein [Saprospiraceae bacterium]